MSNTRIALVFTLALSAGAASAGDATPTTRRQPRFVALGFLPGAHRSCYAWDVSADGTTVVGDCGGMPFRWREGTGMVALQIPPGEDRDHRATAVSSDGSVAVGFSQGAAVRWDAAGRMSVVTGSASAWGVSADGRTVVGRMGEPHVAFLAGPDGRALPLGDLPGGDTLGQALSVSADGSVVTGWSRSDRAPGTGESFLWTRDRGLVPLPGAGTPAPSYARAVSPDGGTVVGNAYGALGHEGFVWDEAHGFSWMGDLPGGGFWSDAVDVARDGRVVVGAGASEGGGEAAVWTRGGGMQSLARVAREAYGLDLAGFRPGSAQGVSADGDVVAGYGTNARGEPEPFLIVLPRLAERLAQLAPPPEERPAAPSAELALWYRFDESSGPVLDASGRALHGTVGNLTRGEPGVHGGAGTFTGAGGVTAPAGAVPDLTRGATMEFWLNPLHAGRHDDAMTVLSAGKGGETFQLSTSCGNLSATFTRAQGSASATAQCGTLSPGRWSHVAVVNDGTRVRLFVDLRLVGEGPGGSLGPIPGEVFVGHAGREGRTHPLLASMDDLRIWSGVRSIAEICEDAGGRWRAPSCALEVPQVPVFPQVPYLVRDELIRPPEGAKPSRGSTVPCTSAAVAPLAWSRGGRIAFVEARPRELPQLIVVDLVRDQQVARIDWSGSAEDVRQFEVFAAPGSPAVVSGRLRLGKMFELDGHAYALLRSTRGELVLQRDGQAKVIGPAGAPVCDEMIWARSPFEDRIAIWLGSMDDRVRVLGAHLLSGFGAAAR